MAARPVEISRVLPGVLAAISVAAFVLCAVGAVLWFAGGGGMPGPGDWAALRFTVMQAALSALCSVGLAIPVARALARRAFPGRSVLITLLGAPFILPVIVAVLGLLAVFGRNGVLSNLLGVVGLPPLSIYGLHGVLLAHVFFNLPLATRLILQGWQDIPAERFRLAATLGMGPGQVLRFLEWPMLRRVLPSALLTVFGLCLSSFAVVLMLGGGPKPPRWSWRSIRPFVLISTWAGPRRWPLFRRLWWARSCGSACASAGTRRILSGWIGSSG